VEDAIRFLLHLLLAALIAAAVGVAGFALLLALRQGPAPAAPPAVLRPVPSIPDPTRLRHMPSFVPASAPVFRGAQTATAPLPIEVRDLSDDVAAHAGVAVFDVRTGALLQWLPLANAQRSNGALRIAPELPKGAPLRLLLAGGEDTARRSWFARVEVAADHSGEAAVALPCAVQRVTVRAVVPDGYGQDLQLRRVGDVEWRPPPNALRADADLGGAIALVLGSGSYELQPCTGGPWQPVIIAVPGPGEVTATFARPARGDRP
jgi:hypothetical protein